jgi:hypothetical protein
MRALLIALALLALGSGTAASATPEVRVLETYPAGQSVTLANSQTFYLRLAYASDKPIGIWLHPYYRGKQAAAGTSPSIQYTGKGQALAWFFLSEPGQRIDEIRIEAGDGGNDMPVVATYPVAVTQGTARIDANSPWAPTEPDWVSTLREQSNERLEASMGASEDEAGTGGMAILGGFMLLVGALGIGGLAAPLLALRRWQGGWKLAAAVPAGIVGFVILRIVVDTGADPTSHNLWPFEVLIAGLASLAVVGALAVARRLTANPSGPLDMTGGPRR